MVKVAASNIRSSMRDSAIFAASLLAFASCAKSGAGSAGNALVTADATAIANNAALAAYIKLNGSRFYNCYRIVGFVTGSGILRDGELQAANERFRDIQDSKRIPITVVAFGDNVVAGGDAAADRHLALSRAAFVTQRLKSLGVPVSTSIAIGGPSQIVDASATSVEMYSSCTPGSVSVGSEPKTISSHKNAKM